MKEENRTKRELEFINKIQQAKPHYKIIGKYIDSQTPIQYLDKKTGKIKYGKPINLVRDRKIRGEGTHSWVSHKMTNDDYITKFYDTTNNLELLSKYIDSQHKVHIRCLLDNNDWWVKPSSPLRGIGCPICGGTNKLSDDFFKKRLHEINPNIETLSKYKTNKEKVLCRCLVDGFEWYARPHDLFYGHGCPQCSKESFGEKAVRKFLVNNNIYYIPQYRFNDCKYKLTLPFDFYLPKYNICIEYQGQQHYYPVDFAGQGTDWAKEQLELCQKRDCIKKDYCKNNNILLITIPYYDFDNIDKILEDLLITKFKEENRLCQKLESA